MVATSKATRATHRIRGSTGGTLKRKFERAKPGLRSGAHASLAIQIVYNRLAPIEVAMNPMITAREWRKIAAHLPPHSGPGKPRQDDRRFVSAFFYAAACNCSLESLPPIFGNPRSLRTRRQRWERDGTL